MDKASLPQGVPVQRFYVLLCPNQPLQTSGPRRDLLFRTLLVSVMPDLASIEIKNYIFPVASQWQFILFIWRICCLLQDELKKIVFMHVSKKLVTSLYLHLPVQLTQTILTFRSFGLEIFVSQHFPELILDMQRRFLAKYPPKCIISDTLLIQ